MNSEMEFLYPEWQIPVQDVILETDPAKLPAREHRKNRRQQSA
ncbi:MAG: hypothetical protein WCC21_04595 [Candidatus Acidiferrales bacterium]